MFNHHNLPKSLVNEAANLLGKTNSDFELPSVLQDIVAEAAKDYVMCPTQEDRKAIIEWHIDQVVNIKDVDQQTIVNFERAVEHAVMSESPLVAVGRIAMQAARNPVVQQIAAQTASDVIKSTLEKNKKEPTVTEGRFAAFMRLAGAPLTPPKQKPTKNPENSPTFLKGKKGGAPLVHIGSEPIPHQQNQSFDYSELVDVLATLNEQELNAYFNIITVGEGGMISEQQAEELYNVLIESEII